MAKQEKLIDGQVVPKSALPSDVKAAADAPVVAVLEAEQETTAAPAGYVLLDLDSTIGRRNGKLYGPGKNVAVPDDLARAVQALRGD